MSGKMDAQSGFCLCVLLLCCLVPRGEMASVSEAIDGREEQSVPRDSIEKGSDGDTGGDDDGPPTVKDSLDVGTDQGDIDHGSQTDPVLPEIAQTAGSDDDKKPTTVAGPEAVINHRQRHGHDAEGTKGSSRSSSKTAVAVNGDGKTSQQVPGTAVANEESVKSGGCPKCKDKETEKQLRMDYVKNELLRKMNLQSIPKVDKKFHRLPVNFYNIKKFDVNDEPDDEYTEPEVETKQIFIYGEDITDQCMQKKGGGCYSFKTANKQINPDEIGSVELWIYKQRDPNDHHIQTFMVSELAPHYRYGKQILRFRNIVKRLETKMKQGWIKFYVKRTVHRWLSKPHRNFGLAVVCKTCRRHSHRAIFGEKEGLMPILVINMNKKVHRRHRRSSDCNEGGNNCCHAESLEIKFSDIGWDFIEKPASIRPNFCTGSCNGILAAHYNHTRVVQTIQQSVLHDVPKLTPCCAPVKFRKQGLIYRDHNNDFRKIEVADLLVRSCGCA